MLEDKVADQLQELYQDIRTSGQVASSNQLNKYLSIFREKFGPDRLANLDGRDLLYTLHALRKDRRDSLVYWLEFKNDDEFPSRIFGSISGGSALKFGIYQRKEDGLWMTGIPQKQIELTEEDAITIARKHRQQLLAGSELIRDLPDSDNYDNYRLLQERMDEITPDISDTAWAHKYFHLLFPEKLDNFHVPSFQRFHLIKLLLSPPAESGRYVAAAPFVAVSRELKIPMPHLMVLLNKCNGRPYRYWRVGTMLEGKMSRWTMMRDNNWVAIGWSQLGDLSHVSYNRESKESIREALNIKYPNTPQLIGRKTQEIFNFVAALEEGDLVLASEGLKVLGIGRVVGEYTFDSGSDAPHRRPVEWLSLREWKLPKSEGLRTTVFSIRKHAENQIEVERQILEWDPRKKPRIREKRRDVKLKGIPGRIQSVLNRKKQVILYGPPGTGKTYWARIAAQDLAAYCYLGQSYDHLTKAEQNSIWTSDEKVGALVRMCTFHPAYGYEDFIEGYRPQTIKGRLVFKKQDGIFKRLCDKAERHPKLNYYLIVDEINRGDIPRIFGELLTVLEQDKREQTILLPLSGEAFSVPLNVYVIGTMNTADRSIALLDTALRRRFGFIELMPDLSILKGAVVGNAIPLAEWLSSLNERILANVGRDARNLQIGHSYMLHNGRPVTDFSLFARIVQDDIIPLLEEYCYEDYDTLSKILGDVLVDGRKQRIRQDLFKPERRDDLVDGLLRLTPDLIATSDVVASQAESNVLEAEAEQTAEGEDEDE